MNLWLLDSLTLNKFNDHYRAERGDKSPGECNQYAEIGIQVSLEKLPKNGTYVLVYKLKFIVIIVFKW